MNHSASVTDSVIGQSSASSDLHAVASSQLRTSSRKGKGMHHVILNK